MYDCVGRYTSQLEAQQKETASAAATLEEAAREMDLIRTEKKALLQKWRSSLLQIERCDEQLTATEFATRQWKEKELAIDGEITSFRKSIKNEQEKNELLVGQVTKVRSEAGYLEKQIDVCMSEHAQLTEQFNLFKLSLEKAEVELKEADSAKKSVLDEQVPSRAPPPITGCLTPRDLRLKSRRTWCEWRRRCRSWRTTSVRR
jgi:chromosome segregation ATPase